MNIYNEAIKEKKRPVLLILRGKSGQVNLHLLAFTPVEEEVIEPYETL